MIAQDAACPVWVHFDGKQYCSPDLERAQQNVKSTRYVVCYQKRTALSDVILAFLKSYLLTEFSI